MDVLSAAMESSDPRDIEQLATEWLVWQPDRIARTRRRDIEAALHEHLAGTRVATPHPLASLHTLRMLDRGAVITQHRPATPRPDVTVAAKTCIQQRLSDIRAKREQRAERRAKKAALKENASLDVTDILLLDASIARDDRRIDMCDQDIQAVLEEAREQLDAKRRVLSLISEDDLDTQPLQQAIDALESVVGTETIKE